MASALGYVCCVLTLIAAAGKIRSARGAPMSTSRKYLVVALVAFSLVLAVSAPATLRHAAQFEPIPNAALLLTNVLAMIAAFCVLGVLTHSLDHDLTRRRSAVHVAVLLLSLTAMTALFAEGSTQHTLAFAATYGRDPLIISYMALYLGYMSWSLGRFLWLLSRYTAARDAHPLVRRGFQVTLLGIGVGLAWVVWKICCLVMLPVAGHAMPTQIATSEVLGVLAVSLGAAGTTYTSWAPKVLNLRIRRQVRGAIRDLDPLWRRLVDAVPQVRFSDDEAQWLSTLTPDERAEYRLYRRTLEIRDAQLALRPYIPTPVPEWVAQVAHHRHIDPAATVVLREATELATALDAHHAGRRQHSRQVASTAPLWRSFSAPNLLTEARWLIHVGAALRHHPVVAELRDRARHC